MALRNASSAKDGGEQADLTKLSLVELLAGFKRAYVQAVLEGYGSSDVLKGFAGRKSADLSDDERQRIVAEDILTRNLAYTRLQHTEPTKAINDAIDSRTYETDAEKQAIQHVLKETGARTDSISHEILTGSTPTYNNNALLQQIIDAAASPLPGLMRPKR